MEKAISEEQFEAISQLFFENRMNTFLVEAFKTYEKSHENMLDIITDTNLDLFKENKTMYDKNKYLSLVLETFKQGKKN